MTSKWEARQQREDEARKNQSSALSQTSLQKLLNESISKPSVVFSDKKIRKTYEQSIRETGDLKEHVPVYRDPREKYSQILKQNNSERKIKDLQKSQQMLNQNNYLDQSMDQMKNDQSLVMN